MKRPQNRCVLDEFMTYYNDIIKKGQFKTMCKWKTLICKNVVTSDGIIHYLQDQIRSIYTYTPKYKDEKLNI
eukprot:snap_masked-scaffold_57-processed-gene-1.19-mRNA-1 protein AED:1.00 eAED:1.00 QI:0/-1/0/0/-1/1/1/0/71